MPVIEILAVGVLKNDPLADLAARYVKMSPWHIDIKEFKTEEKMVDAIDAQAFLIAMDEKGKSLSSPEFATFLQGKMDEGLQRFQFVIGGADGLPKDVKDKANYTIAFGRQTWPHMMARVMLIEQIYRAQTILSGHPYHRD